MKPLGVWTDAQVQSACVVALNDDGYVLVVREPKVSGFLGLPGGKREKGETIIQCMKREAHEEAGLVVHRQEHVVRSPVGGMICDCFLALSWSLPNESSPSAMRFQWVHPARLVEKRGTRFPEFYQYMMPWLVAAQARTRLPKGEGR